MSALRKRAVCIMRGPMRTRVKICGITRPEDGLEAAHLGADAIGLVFWAPSPRNVEVARARQIVAALPPFVTVVGLFVDAPPSHIENVLREVPLDMLQFHGDEAPGDCERFGKPYLKAVRVRGFEDIAAAQARFASARGLLLDAYRPELPGGTGHRFDWGMIPQGLSKPVILAGGLNPGNVAAAVRQVRPYAVDVSSGVETDKGIKSAAKVAAFIQGVRQGDEQHDSD